MGYAARETYHQRHSELRDSRQSGNGFYKREGQLGKRRVSWSAKEATLDEQLVPLQWLVARQDGQPVVQQPAARLDRAPLKEAKNNHNQPGAVSRRGTSVSVTNQIKARATPLAMGR